MRRQLQKHSLAASDPLGFHNGYALALKRERAKALKLKTISDLAQHKDLSLRFSSEFVDREDGWKALRKAYDLPQTDVLGVDHDLAYRGLLSGQIDLVDAYTTDAQIVLHELTLLIDDRKHFPRYDALWIYRSDLDPAALAELEKITGKIDEAAMQKLNVAARADGAEEGEVARRFVVGVLPKQVVESGGKVASKDAPNTAPAVDSLGQRVFKRTLEHLELTLVSLLAAVLLALPLGIVAARRKRLGRMILGAVGVLQTIPSLALLVFMIPLLGIGKLPALFALFVYSLLPIVRNTHDGLKGISAGLLESADALGLPRSARMWQIELPLASRSILAGIKIAAVINVGTATLGALIGAGGYGQPIVAGIRRMDVSRIMEGALPAALLALLIQGLFDVSERWVIPRGLRHEPADS